MTAPVRGIHRFMVNIDEAMYDINETIRRMGIYNEPEFMTKEEYADVLDELMYTDFYQNLLIKESFMKVLKWLEDTYKIGANDVLFYQNSEKFKYGSRIFRERKESVQQAFRDNGNIVFNMMEVRSDEHLLGGTNRICTIVGTVHEKEILENHGRWVIRHELDEITTIDAMEKMIEAHGYAPKR